MANWQIVLKASILDAHKIASDSRKPLILLTFPRWHLNWRYNTKKGLSEFMGFEPHELRSMT